MRVSHVILKKMLIIKNKIKVSYKSLCKSKSSATLKCESNDMIDKASSSISLNKVSAASFSIEAALVLPLFLWFVLMMFYFFLLLDVQGELTMAMSKVSKELGQYQYCQQEYSGCFLDQYVSDSIIKEIKKSSPNDACISNGIKGIEFTLSGQKSNRIDIVAKYYLKIPVPIFDLLEYPVIQRVLVHSWTGFNKNELNENQETMVYVTEDGIAYHQYRTCTYLDLSIRSVSIDNIKKLRNINGGKYHCCERCGRKGNVNNVYITTWGNRYHTSLGCSGLKRTVRAVPISQVGSRHKCSKCW